MEKTKEYFSNLLILQYRNKPKAKATIETLAELAFSDTTGKILPIEVQNAYNIDTASGKQLDVIGKYLGYDRTLNFAINDAFTFADYSESEPSSLGLSDYIKEKNTYPLLEYRYEKYDYYTISDDTYRKVLKMLSLLRSKPLSLANIDYALEEAFEGLIYVSEGDKSLEYHIAADLYTVLDVQYKLNAFFYKYFPLPMGCTMTVVRDPFYLNLIPYGGAENYIDENFIYTRAESSLTTYFKTLNGFDVQENQDFEIQMKVKIDASNTSTNDWCYTAIDGDNGDFNKKYGFGLAKRSLTNSFAMINKNSQGQLQYIDLFSYTGYTDVWVTLNLKRENVGSPSIIATLSVDGVVEQEVDTHWGLVNLQNAYFILGVDLFGSIDFKECWIKIDNEMVWKGITSKKIRGV